MSSSLFQIARAQVNTNATRPEIGLKEAIGGNFADIILGLPWWFFITLGLILLYISWVLEQRKDEKKQES